jgi:hypothetical protein
VLARRSAGNGAGQAALRQDWPRAPIPADRVVDRIRAARPRHGRPLRLDEMTYITEVVRRLKCLLLMGQELDANYRAAAENAMDRKL